MKKSIIISFLIVPLLLFYGCKKEEPATKPLLSTTPASNITTTSAISGGVIADDGGTTIISNGVCWGKTENPTIEGSKTNESVGTGQFVSNLTGLDAGTTYHVRAYATNPVGTSYGADMTFLTLGQAPSGLTQPPSNVTAVTATLNATVNPNDLSTTVTFEYGLTTSYGSTAAASPSPVTGNTMVNVMAEISGLLPATTYHYRVKTVNSIGTTYSEDKTFTTAGIPPAATTSAATSKSTTGATLNGTVNANNTSTTVTFEYGTTTSYGQTVTASPSSVEGMTNTDVSASITGLTAGTSYHFRVKAVNSVGTTYGSDMTFTTEGLAPTATTLDATSKTTTGATLNASINANMASTTVTFEYGTTTSYGQTVTASQSPVTGSSNTNVSANISGLSAGTTYHFRVKAVNSVGTTYGSDMTFTTAGLAPTATTMAATNKTATGATLNATVNANMVSTAVTFEYGTTTSYGQTVNASQSPVTGNAITNVSANLTGLTAGTTYHFRVKAVNSVGTTYGSDMTFTTLYPPPPTSGLSAYYPFNGNANDESVNNYNGTVTGAVLSPDRFGTNNSSYYFNGINNKIYIGNSLIVQDRISVSCWVKSTATSGQIISTGSRNSYRIGKTENGVDCGLYLSDATDGYGIGASAVVDCSDWTHVVIVYNGSEVKLYINGQLKSSDTGAGSVFCNQTVYLNFGTYQWGSSCSDWYKGYLDDVRLYNRAITSEEVNALYHEGGW